MPLAIFNAMRVFAKFLRECANEDSDASVTVLAVLDDKLSRADDLKKESPARRGALGGASWVPFGGEPVMGEGSAPSRDTNNTHCRCPCVNFLSHKPRFR